MLYGTLPKAIHHLPFTLLKSLLFLGTFLSVEPGIETLYRGQWDEFQSTESIRLSSVDHLLPTTARGRKCGWTQKIKILRKRFPFLTLVKEDSLLNLMW
jgi:hypothetical protein